MRLVGQVTTHATLLLVLPGSHQAPPARVEPAARQTDALPALAAHPTLSSAGTCAIAAPVPYRALLVRARGHAGAATARWELARWWPLAIAAQRADHHAAPAGTAADAAAKAAAAAAMAGAPPQPARPPAMAPLPEVQQWAEAPAAAPLAAQQDCALDVLLLARLVARAAKVVALQVGRPRRGCEPCGVRGQALQLRVLARIDLP